VGVKRSTSRGRVYPQSFSTDRRIGRLGLHGLALFPLLWVNCDDQGRICGDPEEIKYAVCPNVDQLTKANIPDILAELEKHSLILRYETVKGAVIQICDWWDVHRRPQWSWPSEYPPPNGWKDHLRYKRGKKEVVTINWPPSPESPDDVQVSAGVLSGEFSPEGTATPPQTPPGNKLRNMKDEDEDEYHLNFQVKESSAAASQKEFQEITKVYEKDIGEVTPGVEEELRAAVALYPAAWVKEAIREAVKGGASKKNLRYIAGVLANFSKERVGGKPNAAIREIPAEELNPDPLAVEIWDKVLAELQTQVAPAYYRTWLKKSTGIGYANSKFTIGVSNEFVAGYLNQNQRSLIEKILIAHTRPDVSLSFVVVKAGDDV
jgi:hypothetical protein